MSGEQFEHIRKIRNDKHHASESIKADLNNAIQHLAEDLYKEHIHFIFELIQNAEDNTYKDPLLCPPFLSFRLTKTDPTYSKGSDGALIIQNNETGFNRANVDAICAVGKTTKKKEQGYIGEKGIGFKSVFRVTENPHIFSNGYHFCLPERDEQTGLGYIVPQWIDTPPEGLDLSKTHIILPLNKSGFGYKKIEDMLQGIEPETILFLSELQKIQIETDTGTDLTILKDNTAKPKVKILIKGKKQGCSFSTVDDFLVCTKCFDKPAAIYHEKRERIENRKISIAFPLDENSTSIGKIFAYLLVRSDTEFPFLINADFILTNSREDLQDDVPWNRWLMKCVANLVVCELLPLLKKEKFLTVLFLEALANKLNNLAEDKNNLFYPIFSKLHETLMNEEFLPANDGTYVSASNAKLARGNPIRSLLNHKQLGELFCPNKVINEIKWLSDDITQDLTPELRTYLTLKLNVKEVDPSMFARQLTPLFLSTQCDEWFIKFYKFLSDQSSLWHHQWSVLRAKPILRLQDGEHVNPFQEDGSPNAYLPIGQDTDTSFPVLKVKLTQDNEARGFLTKLGIPKWNIVDEVIRHILPRYGTDFPTVSLDTHRDDFAKIERAYETDSKEKQNRLRQVLRKTPFILIESSGMGNRIYHKPNQLYFPSDELRLYFKGNAACAFVDINKYPVSARRLFKELGVADSIRVERKQKDSRGHVIIYSSHGRHKRGLNGFDPNIQIDGLEHAIGDPTLGKSAFIWNEIVRPNADCIRGTTEESTNQQYTKIKPMEEMSDNFGCLLIDKEWLPDSNENMHKPRDITLAELPESFERDERLTDQLCMKKDTVAELAEETGVSVEIIEEFRQNPKAYAEFKAWQAEKKALEEKEKEVPEQPLQEKNVPYDGTLTDTFSTPPESSSNTSSRSSMSSSNSQGSSQESASRGSSGGGSGGHGGGGGGPGKEHENLKNYLAHNPSQLGEGLRLVQKEYTFKSSGRVDILLMDSSGKPVTVEVKPHISSGSDSEVLQALKYKHLAAADYNIPCEQVRCILVAPEIPDDVRKKCTQLGIEPFIPTTNK